MIHIFFVDKNLSNLLTTDGVIQANYGFTVASEAVKKYFGIPSSKDIALSNPFAQMVTK